MKINTTIEDGKYKHELSRIEIITNKELKIYKKLLDDKYINTIGITSKDADLRIEKEAESIFKLHKPEYVFLCAAKVGGIKANNTYPVEFLYDNIMCEYLII